MHRSPDTFPPEKFPRSHHSRWVRGILCFAAAATLIAPAQPPQQDPIQNPPPGYLRPEANRLPDKNERMLLDEQRAKTDRFEAANAERKRQIADDTAKLLALATELKTEVDKTSKDTLSLSVIRKAETIERLAKGVKEKMKLTVGAS